MSIDANKVIQKLINQLAQAHYTIALLECQIEEMEGKPNDDVSSNS